MNKKKLETNNRHKNIKHNLNGQEIIKFIAKTLPHQPGVYQMEDEDGQILYIGKAKNLSKRVINYTNLNNLTRRLQRMVSLTKKMNFFVTNTEIEALLLECNLIKRHKPRFNIILRDDKSFPYILINKEHKYPRLQKYRGTKKIKGDYFGPFVSPSVADYTLIALQKAFLLRSCSEGTFRNRSRPCLLYDIKRCSGPCVEYINEVKPYHTNIREYVARYEGDDQFQGDVTDFDQHSFFDTSTNYFRQPSGDFGGDEITRTQGLNKSWSENYTYYLDSIVIVTAGTGFLDNPIITISAPDLTGGVQAIATAKTEAQTYADGAVADAIDAAPAGLDTLNELAAALNDDANFASTMTTSLASKADDAATTAALATKSDQTDLDTLPLVKDVYITMLPGNDFKEVAHKAKELVENGFNPVPHFPARSIKNLNELKEYTSMCKDFGVKQALVIGGGADPIGDYHCSLQILESGLFEGMKIGIAGHPDGSPDISDSDLEKAMKDKMPFADYIVTQWLFCLLYTSPSPRD